MSRPRRGAIVAGVLGGKPTNGGHAWSRVSFVVGLRRLGFDVAGERERYDADLNGERYGILWDWDGEVPDAPASLKRT